MGDRDRGDVRGEVVRGDHRDHPDGPVRHEQPFVVGALLGRGQGHSAMAEHLLGRLLVRGRRVLVDLLTRLRDRLPGLERDHLGDLLAVSDDDAVHLPHQLDALDEREPAPHALSGSRSVDGSIHVCRGARVNTADDAVRPRRAHLHSGAAATNPLTTDERLRWKLSRHRHCAANLARGRDLRVPSTRGAGCDRTLHVVPICSLLKPEGEPHGARPEVRHPLRADPDRPEDAEEPLLPGAPLHRRRLGEARLPGLSPRR